jgi:hypothetical protein
MTAASGGELVRRSFFVSLFFFPNSPIDKDRKLMSSLTHHSSFSLQVACLIRVPTEVVKSLTQTSAYGLAPNKTSSLESAKVLLRSEGIRGFYRGFGITVTREVSSFSPSSFTPTVTS